MASLASLSPCLPYPSLRACLSGRLPLRSPPSPLASPILLSTRLCIRVFPYPLLVPPSPHASIPRCLTLHVPLGSVCLTLDLLQMSQVLQYYYAIYMYTTMLKHCTLPRPVSLSKCTPIIAAFLVLVLLCMKHSMAYILRIVYLYVLCTANISNIAYLCMVHIYHRTLT